jgi:hypothetical protein
MTAKERRPFFAGSQSALNVGVAVGCGNQRNCQSEGGQMDSVDALSARAGSWRGTSTLQAPHTGIAAESPSTLSVTAAPAGVRLDYTWSYQGKLQRGSILLGTDDAAGAVTARWTDTWHTGNQPMACSGPKPGGLTFSVRGTYAAPPGPDWGWRIDVTPDDDQLRIVMHNVWPEEQGGKEELAVDAIYEGCSDNGAWTRRHGESNQADGSGRRAFLDFLFS